MSKIVKVKNLNIGQGRPKICAIVLGETSEEILELAERSNSEPCDLIEFRADHYEHALEMDKVKGLLRRLRKTARKPIIFTFRTEKEGGKKACSGEYYKNLLSMVAENSLCELIDVEERAVWGDGDFIPSLKEKGACVIISKHDFSRTPEKGEIMKTLMDMEKTGADILKVAYMPANKGDVLNLMSAVEEVTSSYASCPVIAISMGQLGMVTRVLGEFIESAVTFASITKASAPGQINVQGVERVLDIIHENYKKIFLAGFMGTGKTSVANAMAKKYGIKQVDLDEYIQKKENAAVSDIFREYSEAVFRDKETKYLRQVLRQNYQVISLGGGTVLRQENLDLIRQSGVIVLLTASPEEIARRVKNDGSRPLLGDNFDLDYIRSLMKSREEAYMKYADIVVNTDGKSVDEVCAEIIDRSGLTL